MTQTLPEKNFEDEIKTLPDDPYVLFRQWLNKAEQSEPNDPNAMALATCGENGMPAVRMVLLKGLDERGFVFYTNEGSKKGQHLVENPKAALCFHWKSIRRQIRIEGDVEIIAPEEADDYYKTRHRGSRIGAWASKQSRPLGDYKELQDFVAEYDAKFENADTIPRPEYWKGYRVKPQSIEFWIDGEYRLHRRYLYTLDESGWTIQMLYP